MVTNERKDTMQRVVEEIWNQGALDLADSLFAPDYINHGGLIPDLVRGPEAIKVSVALYRLAFPALQVAIDDLAIDGEMATLWWTARGVPTDDSISNAAAEVKQPLVGRTISRFAGCQIVESWTTWGAAGAARRLGLDPLLTEREGEVRKTDGARGFDA